MNLDELQEFLEHYPRHQVVERGFNNPHSYRGFYDQVAFEWCEQTTVGDMLDCVDKALSETFYGYKGGEFRYNKDTKVFFAYYGSCQDDDKETEIKILKMFLRIANGKDIEYMECW
jgi:hypothetical protein